MSICEELVTLGMDVNHFKRNGVDLHVRATAVSRKWLSTYRYKTTVYEHTRRTNMIKSTWLVIPFGA
jgi:hypothetical protein